MTFLEFIRKNSLLVLIVIFGVGVGLLMMDYGDKGSAFSRDSYIQVDGVNYSYPEAAMLGENGREYIQSLFSATTTKLRVRFDSNEDDMLQDDEKAALDAWLSQNPQFNTAYSLLESVYNSWSYGPAREEADNIAINRAILKAEADALGIRPSREQVDAYIQAMPAFRNADGSFDQALYHRMTGFRNGIANNPQEQAFRSVVSDVMIWECLYGLLTDGIRYDREAQAALVDAIYQTTSGKTAWLRAEDVPTPAEPTEEEVKAYWETHKEQYKSDERRIISVYTLTPSGETTLDALMSTADILMQDLSQANGQGFDQMLETAAENPENAPFTFRDEKGATHRTSPLCSLASLPEELKLEVDHNGETLSLGKVAFTEVETAPTVAEYEAAAREGRQEKLSTIRQIRGFFPTRDGRLALIRVEAIEAPSVLPYEEAREKALADLRQEKADNALADAARKLYDDMNAALSSGGMNAAFDKAKEAGATVETFGPVALGSLSAPLPTGLTPQALMSTASGKLAPLAIQPEGARISAVVERTVEDSPQYTYAKYGVHLPTFNQQLGKAVMTDWQNTAYTRYNVLLSEKVKTSASN